jgi:hypothetical protein
LPIDAACKRHYGHHVDPRTFLPPRALALRAAPRPGERARDLPAVVEAGRPAVIAFLRHVGCPFAEATMRELGGAARRSPDIQWIAISHAPAHATERWCEAIGGAGEVSVACDPSRALYAQWGLGRTELRHFLGIRSLSAVARLARGGIRNRHPSGTRWQSAGTFALDEQAIVRWRLLPAHAGELPDLDEAVRALA